MNRLIVLTDITRGLEVDDIQSMVRLLLYVDVIDIEGLIATTSTWHRTSRPRDVRIIHRLIDAYAEARSNLRVHSAGYPDPARLRSVVAQGITSYGRAVGDGFAHARYSDNPGVRTILAALERDDPRPLWIALWGGANTLAQALWTAERAWDRQRFEAALSRLRVHAICDQDATGRWIRETYGDRLFYIVAPSAPTNGKHYHRATWPGISADSFRHGSEDGVLRGGFTGADRSLISRRWLRRNIRARGSYGRQYPIHLFIMEGDTPSYLSLIPTGLSDPERPDQGGWGGRYELQVPTTLPGLEPEPHPVWTTVSDTVMGIDGRMHTSPQATIWRWRAAFQNDFAARIMWTATAERSLANHPPVVELTHAAALSGKVGDTLLLDASASRDPDGADLDFCWFVYPEAGHGTADVRIQRPRDVTTPVTVVSAEAGATIHVIVAVTDRGLPPLTRYGRVVISAPE